MLHQLICIGSANYVIPRCLMSIANTSDKRHPPHSHRTTFSTGCVSKRASRNHNTHPWNHFILGRVKRRKKMTYTNPTIFETHHLNSSSFEGPWTLPVKAGTMLGSTGQTLHRHWWTRCLRLIWNSMNKHTPLGMLTNTEIGSFQNKDSKKPIVKWQVTCDDGRFQTLFLKFCKEQQSALPLGRFLTCTQDSIVCDNVRLAMLWL